MGFKSSLPDQDKGAVEDEWMICCGKAYTIALSVRSSFSVSYFFKTGVLVFTIGCPKISVGPIVASDAPPEATQSIWHILYSGCKHQNGKNVLAAIVPCICSSIQLFTKGKHKFGAFWSRIEPLVGKNVNTTTLIIKGFHLRQAGNKHGWSFALSE